MAAYRRWKTSNITRPKHLQQGDPVKQAIRYLEILLFVEKFYKLFALEKKLHLKKYCKSRPQLYYTNYFLQTLKPLDLYPYSIHGSRCLRNTS